jgi:hypothetical protein
MIKKLLSIALIATAMFANAQSFTGVYTFSAVASGTASTGYTDPTPVPVAAGLTFGSFTAVGTGTSTATNPGAAGRFVFDNWPTGATTGLDVYANMTGSINVNEYYNVTLMPASGYSLTISSITFGVRRSGTGIRNYAVRSSADSYSANIPASVGTNTNLSVVSTDVFFWNFDATATSADQVGSTVTLSGANFTDLTSPISFRFYGWNSEGSGGNFSIDNVNINGSVSLATSIATLNFDLNTNFNVYPVPNNDGIVYIENKNAQELSSIEVIDVFGNVVLSSKNETASKIKLNLADVSNGNYVVRINTANSSTTKKLVILK